VSNAVLWDMDGVLIDTGPLHYQTWAAALTPRGVQLTPEQFRLTFGMNNRGVLTSVFGYEPDAELLALITDEKEQAFRRLIRGAAQPLPGVVTWLERLRSAGVRQAVASSAPPENIEVVIDELGLRAFFDTLVSAARMAGKPDPAVFLEAARRLGARPGECVVVEDAVPGVEAARRAGMRCIAVTTTNPASALAGAQVVVDSLADLPADAFSRLFGAA
jgi:HAD superfamily hydrolase (TIGR01509 family)